MKELHGYSDTGRKFKELQICCWLYEFKTHIRMIWEERNLWKTASEKSKDRKSWQQVQSANDFEEHILLKIEVLKDLAV